MAGEPATEEDAVDRTPDFGQVSRLRGRVFQSLSYGASIVGILALIVLLTYVFWDAFGLWTAGWGWYATYGLTVVAPVAVFVWYARTRPATAEATLELVSGSLGGVLLGFAAVVVFLIIAGGPVWFAYFLTVVGPLAALGAYGRYDREATWTGLGMLGVLLVGPVVGTFALDPLSNVARLVGTPAVMVLTLAIPGSAVLWYALERRFEYERRVAAAGGLVLLAVTLAGIPVVSRFDAVSPAVWVTFFVMVFIPNAVAISNTARDRDRWPAFTLPVALIGGFLLGRTAVGVAGFKQPSPWLDWQFLTSTPSTIDASASGVYPALIGSVFIIVLVALFTFFLGVGAAIYLEEYAPSSGFRGALVRAIRVNISNLAGVPSVVYGLLGLGVFINLTVRDLTLFGVTIPLPFTYTGLGVGTVLTASLTLSLLILPIVIISAQEAIRSVPDSLRRASYGIGATRWQTIRNVVLPEALPGIFTGTIIALGRAVGETAPLIMVLVPATSFSAPQGFFSQASALPRQIYAQAFLPGDGFQHGVTAAGVVVLLIVMLTMNSVAILLRNKFETE